MAEPPEQFFARVSAAAGPDGRLPMPDLTGWEEVVPFELDSLRVATLRPPEAEPARAGEGGIDCQQCESTVSVWRDDAWRLWSLHEATNLFALMLAPLRHADLTDLTDDEAGELGRLIVHVSRAIEARPHIARAHVGRWGDGAEHLHIWFFARPAGQLQLRGNFMTVWDDVLPPIPEDVRTADVQAVARALATSYGGRVTES